MGKFIRKSNKQFQDKTIDTIFVHDINFNTNYAKHVANLIRQNNKYKTKLSFSYTKNLDHIMHYIRTAFRHNNIIKEITLEENDYTEETMKYISKILLHNPIETFELYCQTITKKGMKYFKRAIKRGTILKKIKLYNCMNDEDAILHLISGLKYTKTLQIVDIDCEDRDSIFDESKLYNRIFELIRYNKSIKKMSLYFLFVDFNDKYLKLITDALKYNSTLEELYMHLSFIHEEGLEYMINALEINHTLRVFATEEELDEDYFNSEVYKRLNSLLQRNNNLRPLMVQAANCLKNNNKKKWAKSILPKSIYKDCFNKELCYFTYNFD